MRALLCPLLAGVSLILACGPAEPPATPPPATTSAVTASPPPADTTTEQPVAATEPTATAVASADPAPAPAPAVIDLVDSPGDARLGTAATYLKSGEHGKAQTELKGVLPDVDKTATLDARLAAHAMLGRACEALHDAKCAADQYGIVRASWKDPDAAAKQLDALGGDDKAKTERLRRALNAVGEAMFHAAEQKRLASEKEKFPEYKGKGDKDSVVKHINTKVAHWVVARRKAMDEAEKEYAAVVNIRPFPPPRWVVASASRVGQMWGKFTAEFRASPIPNEWKGTGVIPGSTLKAEEVRAMYYAAIDEASAPQLATARAAFQKCQDTAKKFGINDDYSKHCDAWLAKNPAPAAAP